MLDTETKRRIDTARDILVGKVPDPKSQVEQITIALIYKFMDDMDADSEELGGKRKFFAGEYAHYGWARLLHAGLGGHEMLNLYAEAITKMPENPGIPPLFRDIFKNAYMPYRDPETLKSFLKIIDGFSYDHSERLGDAFEYLLSVLGSQGDAGQFRTPRHIIDFMVAVVDPKKTDIVLDPACGTAGFLISSWKHILKANTNAKGHSTLTPDDRERLAKNFIGYDISPDMVRLSLVNLYLHGFADPHIAEYDSLTSQERWNEYADVILANPPFMSPKGGIKPHNRFSVQSKRSEVLFVDYMAEHLSANGRAGIIVPEGVIFQSQTSYKKLRKMLVEQSLVAVVSLPAGLFQPYSGVKTSILILDKSLARKSRSIGFFKISNDGFGLGAQRRPIEQNDMPLAQAEIGEYLRRLRAGESLEGFQPTLGLIVDRKKVAADGYNLSGERYRDEGGKTTTFPRTRLADICEGILTGPFGSSLHESDYIMNGIPVVNPKNIINGAIVKAGTKTVSVATRDKLMEFTLRENDVVIARRGEMGRCAVVAAEMDGWLCGTGCFVVRLKPECDTRFVFLQMASSKVKTYLEERAVGVTMMNLNQSILSEVQIPLPPLDVQKKVVAEIEGYQKVIDGARVVLDNYLPHIHIQSDWPMEEFSTVISTITPPVKIQTADFCQVGDYPVIDQSQSEIAGRTDDKSALIDGTGGLVIFGDHTCAVKFVNEHFAQGADGIKIIKAGEKLEPKFVYFYLLSYPIQQDGYKRHFGKLKESRIPLPPLAIQQAIVAEIEAEQALVAANRELIARFEKKIATTLARIWGDADSSLSATAPPTEPTT